MIKRYKSTRVWTLLEHAEGNWVLYEDHEAEVKRLRDESRRLRALAKFGNDVLRNPDDDIEAYALKHGLLKEPCFGLAIPYTFFTELANLPEEPK